MADTLETIYRNDSLGATELNDGEHTILTTDANTSYALKDLYVKNTEVLTGSNTYLELNGYRVGNLKTNATGTLIVGPNSTLKIRSTDFPLQVIDQRDIAATSASQLFVKQSYRTSNGVSVGLSDAGTLSAASVSNLNDTTDALYSSSINATHYATNDSNSSQNLYYYTNGSSATQLQNTNYNPYGLSATSLYGRTAWRFNSSTLQYKVLTTNPTTGTFTNASLPLNASFSPFTTSSYPRGDCHHGYYFYIPTNGYPTSLYAINLTTGAWFLIPLTTSISITSSNNFTVAYIPSSDRFVVYRGAIGSNQIVFDILSVTKTYMDTYNTSGLNTLGASSSSGTITLAKAQSSNWGGQTLGYDYLGNVTYKSNSAPYPLITMDRSGTIISEEASFSLNGTSYSFQGNGLSTRRARVLSAGEITSLGLTLPTFGVQILGVKSVNV